MEVSRHCHKCKPRCKCVKCVYIPCPCPEPPKTAKDKFVAQFNSDYDRTQRHISEVADSPKQLTRLVARFQIGSAPHQSLFSYGINKPQYWLATVGSTIYRSQDGLNWSSLVNAPDSFNDLEWNGTYWLVVTTTSVYVLYPNSGGSYDTYLVYEDPTAQFTTVNWNGHYWLAVGAYGVGNQDSVIVTLTDPFDPTTQTFQNYTVTILSGFAAEDVVWNGLQQMVIGTNTLLGSNDSIAWMSLDGINWVQLQDQPELFVEGLSWNGTNWVAVGTGGKIAWLPDIVNIAPQTSPATWTVLQISNLDFLDIDWNGDLFTAVGQNGQIWNSPNGITWTQSTSVTSEDLFQVKWNGRFFIAIQGSTYVYSRNGTEWNAGNFPEQNPDAEGQFTGFGYSTLGATNVLSITQGFVGTNPPMIDNVPLVNFAGSLIPPIAWEGLPAAYSAWTPPGETQVISGWFDGSNIVLSGSKGLWLTQASKINTTNSNIWGMPVSPVTPIVRIRSSSNTTANLVVGNTSTEQWVAVGAQLLSGSPDATVWTPTTTQLPNGLGVAYSGSSWLAVNASTVVRSTDGVTFSVITFPLASGESITYVGWGNKTYLVSTIGTGAGGKIYASTNDGVSFTAVGATRNKPVAFFFGGASMWVLVGGIGSAATGVFAEYSTDDGTTWTATAVPVPPGIGNDVTFYGQNGTGYWAICGYYVNISGPHTQVWYGSNGINYTPSAAVGGNTATTMPSQQILAISVNGGNQNTFANVNEQLQEGDRLSFTTHSQYPGTLYETSLTLSE